MNPLRKRTLISGVKGSKGKFESERIAYLGKINLGGVDQWILIRGCNRHNPILLCLHGGPGTAQIAFAPRYQAELEKHFVVINWDQRGSGKSFSEQIDKESMSIEQLAADTCELIEAILKRFNRQKLYLLGHSWGSVLGLLAVQNCPDLFYSYISVGQVVDIQETGRILYDFLMESAKKSNNTKALRELESIGFPPAEKNSENIMAQIHWAEKFGGVFRRPGLKKEISRTVIFSPDYTLREKLNYHKASSFSFSSILNQLLEVNMLERVPEVQVPIYMCVGRNDYNTPFELVEKYYNALKAPGKELVWFENSAHAPHFEEPEEFSKFMLEKVLGKTPAYHEKAPKPQ